MKAKRRLICPGPNPEKAGKPVGPADCLSCPFQNQCAPRGFLFSILQADWDSALNGGSEIVVSVTETTDCLRRAYFRRTNDEEPLTDRALVKMHFGSGSSAVIDLLTTKAAFVWTELPLSVEVAPGVRLVGVLDEYDPLTNTLWERKSTSIWGYKNGKLPYPEHVQQVLTYAYMLEVLGVRVRSAKLHYTFRDSRQSDPQWVVYDVDLGEMENAWVKAKEAAVAIALAVKSGSVPEGLTDRFENFKCRDCPFRKQCELADQREKNAGLDGFVGGGSE